MTHSFDSRAIGYTDAYGQRFMREGIYRYRVARAMTGLLTDEWPFQVEVSRGEGSNKEQMRQHTVTLHHEGRTFRTEEGQETVQIEVGDLVLWVCRQADAPPFEVVGEQEFFNSTHLTNECGYAHAFGSPGEYAWVDAHGSALEGLVRVKEPRLRKPEDLDRWRKQLADGALVTISGTQADPAEIEILTGQTVYFAVTKTSGASVTHRPLAKALLHPDRLRGGKVHAAQSE